mgnify:CR=1 FL=1
MLLNAVYVIIKLKSIKKGLIKKPFLYLISNKDLPVFNSIRICHWLRQTYCLSYSTVYPAFVIADEITSSDMSFERTTVTFLLSRSAHALSTPSIAETASSTRFLQ